MECIPYSRQDVDESDLAAVREVLLSPFLTQGSCTPRFEAAFAQRHGVAHAVAVSNATSGLHLACLALGVGPASRVWTTPISFVASANCARYCGAAVGFVDIDPRTRNLSIEALTGALRSARAAGTLPQVVVAVHFGGLPCDLEPLRRLADAYGFRIIEDASHATGASYQGHPVGSRYADATVFSFHAVKIITTAEGGMVTTRDAALAQRLRQLRSHGITRDPALMVSPCEGEWYYQQLELGFNYRMTEVQAALGFSQLARLDDFRERRERLARAYDEALADLPLRRPARCDDRRSAWHLYPVELEGEDAPARRGAVFAALRAAGIGVNVHYIPIHLQPYYAALGFRRGDFPAAERYYERTLSLPLFPAMSAAQQDLIVAALRRLVA